jgi:hypothetical protein
MLDMSANPERAGGGEVSSQEMEWKPSSSFIMFVVVVVYYYGGGGEWKATEWWCGTG